MRIEIAISICRMIISVHRRVITDGCTSTQADRDAHEKCKWDENDAHWDENEPCRIHAKNEILGWNCDREEKGKNKNNSNQH